MSNPQSKQAMRRLKQDLEELTTSPVTSVSAAPLDNNMFEWHCNFLIDDTVYHLILFFPDKYPYVSPSAEFVPIGFRFVGGATKNGKKGVQVCLSIFSDFALYHKEWADEKSAGWSPGYTVQTVLLNMVSFLAENMQNSSPWAQDILKHNKGLAKQYKCADCGHSASTPFPPLEASPQSPAKTPGAAATAKGKGKGKGKSSAPADTENTPPDDGEEIVDYMFKNRFKDVKPASKEDLFGFGLIKSGPPHRPALTSPCEFLTGSSYYGMRKAVGKVQSIMKEQLEFFLPMFITPTHGAAIRGQFEATMNEIAAILPQCKPRKTPMEDMVLKTIPNLMSATVVEFSKGTQHTSENSLNGYFALHRLFLWAIEEYPQLQQIIDDRLKVFIDDEMNRNKKACHHIGEWLMLLAGSAKYRWQDAAEAYLSESWRRNVMWYVKDNAKLGFLDMDKDARLNATLTATAVSRKLLAFQVLFLDIAMPEHMSRAEVIARYDSHKGLPTTGMVSEMKVAVDRISNMVSYADWFKVLRLDVLSDDVIFQRLVDSVEYSINVDGYHWSFWKTGGGWGSVLRHYQTGGTPRAEHFKAMAPPKKPRKGKEDGEGAGATEGKGKGKGAGATEVKGKGKGRGKGGAGGKTAAKDKKEEEEEEMEVEVDEEEAPAPATGKGRGRGRGKRKAEEEPPVGRGRGRGGRGGRGGAGRGAKQAKVVESESSEEEGDEEEVKPAAKGRGRGRGRGAGAARGGRGRARGGRGKR